MPQRHTRAPPKCVCNSCYNVAPSDIKSPRSRADRPSPTDPRPQVIDVLAIEKLARKPAQPALPALRLSEDEALELAEQALKAHERDQVGYLMPPSNWPKFDLPFLVFNDIDSQFFRGVLKGNVYLIWKPLPRGCHARTSRAGLNKVPRISIELSDDLRRCSRLDIVATLLHQMIHAYFLQCCGYKRNSQGYALDHGPRFSLLLYSIEKTIVPEMALSPRLPSLWGKVPDRDASTSSGNRADPGRSTCYDGRHGLSRSECEKWRKNKRKSSTVQASDVSSMGSSTVAVDSKGIPRPIEEYLHEIKFDVSEPIPCLRKAYRYPPSAYYELHFENRAFPIFPGELEDYSGTMKSDLFNGRVGIVPTSSWDGFRSLHSFILHGYYDCRLEELNLLHCPGLIGKTGPPCILHQDSHLAPLLLNNVRAYCLAREIKLPRFKAHALARLYKQASTANDPIEVLEEIYHKSGSQHPDKEIRDWVKAWLKVSIPSSTGPYAKEYPTNLQILQKHPDWKERYARLREKGTELITDIDAVEADIASKKQQQAADTSIPKSSIQDMHTFGACSCGHARYDEFAHLYHKSPSTTSSVPPHPQFPPTPISGYRSIDIHNLPHIPAYHPSGLPSSQPLQYTTTAQTTEIPPIAPSSSTTCCSGHNTSSGFSTGKTWGSAPMATTAREEKWTPSPIPGTWDRLQRPW